MQLILTEEWATETSTQNEKHCLGITFVCFNICYVVEYFIQYTYYKFAVYPYTCDYYIYNETVNLSDLRWGMDQICFVKN